MKQFQVSVAALILLSGNMAWAHTQADFYSRGHWPTTDRWIEYYLSTDNNWGSGWISAIDVADSKWSDIDGSDGFYFDRQAEQHDWVTCLNIFNEDSVVERYDFPDSALAEAQLCPGDPLSRFRIAFNTDYTWYFTAGNDNQNNTISARGAGAHEFGHVTGFWEHLTDQCSTANNGQDFHTMCQGPPNGSDWDSEWRKATLETHDIHTFVNAYPP